MSWADYKISKPAEGTPTKAAADLVPGDVIIYLRSNPGWVRGTITRPNEEARWPDRIIVNVDSEPHGYLAPHKNRRFYVEEVEMQS